MLCMLPRTLGGCNLLSATRGTIVHARKLQQHDATHHQRDKLKEPLGGWSYCCSRRGEPVVIKRGVKPEINEAELMCWMEEQCDKAISPTIEEIRKRAKEMAAPTTEGEAAKISSGLKWWELFKNWNSALKGRRWVARRRGYHHTHIT